MEKPQTGHEASKKSSENSADVIEIYFMPNGELVEMRGGAIISVTSQDGTLIEEPTLPRRPKSSSVAGNFFRVATNSTYLGNEQRPGSNT